MTTTPQPLFDMSKAQPVPSAAPSQAASAPLFDMSKAQPVPSAAPQTQAPAEHPSVASRAMSGVGQSLDANIVQPVKAVAESAVTGPQDHKEAIAHIAAGQPGLQLYRLGKYLVDSVESTIDSGKEGYQKGLQDFSRGVDEVRKGDLRNALASAGSTMGDMMSMAQPGTGIGSRVRELSEGTRPGGDLATPLARTATDVGLLAAGEHAPELIEGAKSAAGKVAKTVGVGGLEPAESLRKAAGGSAGIAEKRFPENTQRAAPYLAAEDKISKIEDTPESFAEATHNAKTKVWDKVTDMITAHPGETISGAEIASTIKNSVSDFVRDHEASTGKAIDKWADTFTKKNGGQYPLDQAAKAVTEMNAKLADTYKMDPGTRAAFITRNPHLGMYEDAADALRSKIDEKLDSLGETGSAELRKDYGALAQMERVFEKRAITYGRQAPVSLKQGLGYMAGVAGHPLATAAALAEKYVNSPGYLIRQYLDAAKGKSGPVVGPVVKAATPAAVGVGSKTPTETWVPFKGGDGQMYEHAPEHSLADIQKADPGAAYPEAAK